MQEEVWLPPCFEATLPLWHTLLAVCGGRFTEVGFSGELALLPISGVDVPIAEEVQGALGLTGSSPGGRSQRFEGGRFYAEGTPGRAVKCFDPREDHQRRKHSAGLDLPIKNECAVIEED